MVSAAKNAPQSP